jgi:hypothetical protein
MRGTQSVITLRRSIIIGCSAVALAACGADEIASPGTGGDITIIDGGNGDGDGNGGGNGGGSVTAASACPDIAATGGLNNGGTITTPNGTALVCTLPGTIDASSTLPDTPSNAKVVYEIGGRVDVGEDGGPAEGDSDGKTDTNVTLTIEPGVVVYGGTGNSFLLVNRGNQINAVGTESKPIIFTSEQNVRGETTDASDKQWGGVILLGRAPLNDCDFGGTPGTVSCERQIEGTPLEALYGGASLDDSSGEMDYFQIRFSGFPLDPDNELQSLTTGGTGFNTRIEHFQSFNSADDGVEFFGGAVNGRYFVILGADDDSLDTDSGVQLNLQYGIAVQRSDVGKGLIEGDSGGGGDDTPRQDTRIANWTFVGRSQNSDAAAFRFRGGMDFAAANVILEATDLAGRECLDIDDDETLQTSGPDENGVPFFASVYMACSDAGIYTADGNEAATQAAFNATSNAVFSGATNKNDNATITLTGVFQNSSNEEALPAFDPSVFNRNGFTFEDAGYVGGASPSDVWWDNWTCNAGYANMSGSSNCAASPVV